MKSLVTGGAGFIGSHVAEQLLKIGHQVVVLDDLSGGFEENIPRGAEFIKGSILNNDLVAHLFVSRKFDYVFHLAAYAAEGLSHFIKRFNYLNNVVGSMNLINAAVNTGVQCFVFTSSIAVYGSGQTPMTEDMTPMPEDSYGIAKLAVELDLKATKELFGMDYIIFRPHNCYGPRQNIGDKYRNVIGIFMNRLLKDEPMPIFGNGEQTRAFTHIQDVALPIAESVHFPAARNETFNIGCDKPVSVKALANLVNAAMHSTEQPRLLWLPARNEVQHAFSSHSKLRKVFAMRMSDCVTLEDGLRDMAAWVKQHGARESKPFEAIEITKNLPWK